MTMDREKFENLDVKEQARIFHETPLTERSELLAYSDHPRELVQSLSQEEMYLLTREVDRDERSELVRYANLPQLFFISDMDCWKKDRIDVQGFVRWLEMLQVADEKRLLSWLTEMDYEMVVSAFMQFIEVIKKEYEYPVDESIEDRPFFTLDEVYYVLVDEENLDTVKRAIELLYENRRGRYTALMEGVLSEMEYELEEEAYRKREVRLSERGFPQPEVAGLIYRPITKKEFEEFPLKDENPVVKELDVIPPHYILPVSQDRLFLDEVLLFLQDDIETEEKIREELAWLSNKVIASDGVDFANEIRVRKSIERVRRFVSIALEDLSAKDHKKAAHILRKHWLETIFRWAMTILIQTRDGATQFVKIYWQAKTQTFLNFLDMPYEQTYRALLQTIPQSFNVLNVKQEIEWEDFKNLEELNRMQEQVKQMSFLHERLKEFSPSLLKSIQNQKESQVTLMSLLGTLFALMVLGSPSKKLEISKKDTLQFIPKAFEKKGSQKHLKPELKQQFITQIMGKSTSKTSLEGFWNDLWSRLEEELGRLDLTRPLEPQFITILRITS